MTVAIQETVFNHLGNGVSDTFAYGCKILAAGDLVVSVDDVVQTAGYTVNNVGNPSGGSVTFTVAPPAMNAKVRNERIIKLERTTDYQQNGDFLSRVVNPDFDRLWMALQQVDATTGRSISLPNESPVKTSILPAATLRANKAIVFDADGNVTVSADDYVDQAATTAANAATAAAQAAIATAQAVIATTQAGIAEAKATLAAESEADADLAASRALYYAQHGTGFTEAAAYDFGSVADALSLFPTDFGVLP